MLILGAVLGAAAMYFSPFHHSVTEETQDYALARLTDAESLSREYFVHKDLSARGDAQAWYINQSHTAWKRAGISHSDYYRAQAIGFLRFCIVQEQSGKIETAEKSCAIAKSNLEKWKPEMSFEEFRKIVNNKNFTIHTLPNNSLKRDVLTHAP